MNETRISRSGQTKIYVGKCVRQFKNEKGYKALISAAAIAIIISLVASSETFRGFSETRSGAFALICACVWIGIFNSIQSICRERAIIKREYKTGLHISSYITAHMIYEMGICAIEAFSTTVILFILKDCPAIGVLLPAFIEMFITFFLVTYASDVLAMVVSCIAKTENAAMTAMPFVLILQLVMSGVIFKLEGIAAFLANFTISKWGANAICTIANVNKMFGSYKDDKENYLFTPGHLMRLWLILVLFTLIYGAICVVSLKFVDKDER